MYTFSFILFSPYNLYQSCVIECLAIFMYRDRMERGQ